jgi:hypothetical protein
MNGKAKGFYIVKFDEETERPIRDPEGKCIPIKPGIDIASLTVKMCLGKTKPHT